MTQRREEQRLQIETVQASHELAQAVTALPGYVIPGEGRANPGSVALRAHHDWKKLLICSTTLSPRAPQALESASGIG